MSKNVKPLNTFDILKAITSDEFARFDFKGVVPRDKLPQKVTYPTSIVMNTHKSSQSGEHWLALYYDENGMCSFFDSFGMDPDFYGLKDYIYIKENGNTISNSFKVLIQ